jgi:hypothetical protein
MLATFCAVNGHTKEVAVAMLIVFVDLLRYQLKVVAKLKHCIIRSYSPQVSILVDISYEKRQTVVIKANP